MGAGGSTRPRSGRRAGAGLRAPRRAGRLPPARARRGGSAVLPPPLPRPLPPPLPVSPAPFLSPPGFGGGGGALRGQVPLLLGPICCRV